MANERNIPSKNIPPSMDSETKWPLVLTRFGVALLIGLLWQIAVGWQWGDFIGRSVIIILVTALIYPVENAINRRREARLE